MFLTSHGVQLRVGLLFVVILRHQLEEALSVQFPLLLPMGKIIIFDLSNHIINNGTYEEGCIDNIDVVSLDQLEERAQKDPSACSGATNAEVVFVDAELCRVVVNVFDGLCEILGSRWCLVVVFPEVDEENLGFE